MNKSITTRDFDQGDDDAGYLKWLTISSDRKTYSSYELGYNRNHNAAMKFVTFVHELAHLFLGHLGKDTKLGIPDRRGLEHRMEEIEAESVAYLVAKRNQVEPRSQKYLHHFVQSDESTKNLDLYSIARATGRIERLLDLSKSTRLIAK